MKTANEKTAENSTYYTFGTFKKRTRKDLDNYRGF